MNIIKNLYYNIFQHKKNYLFLHTPAVDSVFHNYTDISILLLTVSFNNPVVLDLHLQLVKEKITDNFYHVILDNSSNNTMRDINKKICAQYGSAWVSLPPNPWSGRHNSRSHGLSLDWGVRHVLPRFSCCTVGFLDHDIFPIKTHSLTSKMKGKKIMGLLQEQKNLWYLWPGFLFIQAELFLTHSVSFLPTRTTDTGGALWNNLYSKISKKDIAWVEEKEEFLREGNSRQSSYYYCLDDWVHTVNASYWSDCSPKEDNIIKILQKLTCDENLTPSFERHTGERH